MGNDALALAYAALILNEKKDVTAADLDAVLKAAKYTAATGNSAAFAQLIKGNPVKNVVGNFGVGGGAAAPAAAPAAAAPAAAAPAAKKAKAPEPEEDDDMGLGLFD